MAKTLAELRVQIDALDQELLNLLNRRAHLAHEVGEAKTKTRNIVYLIPDSNGDYYEYSTWSTFSHALNKEIGKSTSSIRIGSSIDLPSMVNIALRVILIHISFGDMVTIKQKF